MNMNHDNMQHATAVGTFTGTALTVIANINGTDIFKTCILAAIGAVVSFFVSYGLKSWFKK